MQVVLVAARRKMVETLLEAVKAAGLKAEGVDLDAFALVRTLAVNGDGGEDGARVFCHLGGVTNLAVAVGANCFFTRPLSAVWDDEDAGSRLADEIRLSIDYYMTQPQARPVGEVVLSGPGVRRPRARREPRRAPRHPGRAWPTRSVGLDGSAPRPRRGPLPLHRGRRPLARSGGMKPVNLLPQDQRRALPQATAARRAYVVLGVLAVLLAMVAAYVLTTNQVTEHKDQAAVAYAEADRLEAEAAAQAAFTDFAPIEQTRVQSVGGVAQTRFDWERLMREARA